MVSFSKGHGDFCAVCKKAMPSGISLFLSHDLAGYNHSFVMCRECASSLKFQLDSLLKEKDG